MTALGSLSLSSLSLVADAWDMHDAGTGWWVVMMLGMLLFWGLVIAGIVFLLRELGRRKDQLPSRSARAIADERLARGEVSLQEHQKIVAALYEQHPSAHSATHS